MSRQGPIERYDQLAQTHPSFTASQNSRGWTWTDKMIIQDFNKLKDPEIKITERIMMLKTFYMCYFGEITSPINVGALFLRIIASSPHFTQVDQDLVKFSKEGVLELTQYVMPKDLNSIFAAAKQSPFDDSSQEDDNQVGDISPPKEGRSAGLVGEPEDEKDSSPMEELLATVTSADVASFKEAVLTAFSQITDDATTETHLSYRSLHLTASFLVLFLLRRITKRPEDILAALVRQNIHKHYTDMIANPFGAAIPNPSNTLNRVLEQALSPATSAGRELCTIILYLLQSSIVDTANTPVGFLDQKDIGLEAVLKATCMTHIAGAGLPLITLFVTLRTVFNKTERDALEWITYPELVQSVDKIVDLRVTQCQQLDKKESLKLFPYCRLVHQRYHMDLSYKGNEELCFLMASLIDLRMPPVQGTGGASQAAWTNTMNQELKQQITLAAKQMYSGSAGFRLTKCYKDQINFNSNIPRSQVWVPTPSTSEDQEAPQTLPTIINIPKMGSTR